KCTFSIHCENPCEINEIQLMHTKRIIAEWISNALKYSKPSSISVNIRQKQRELYLIIEDNGKGFRWNGEPVGSGLSHISDRARQLSGKVFARRKVAHKQIHGTIFIFHFPYRENHISYLFA
ncbi:MAG: hypothetical protein D6767_04315, partial [Candidatus Hydrogenedentota bacterium]